MQRELGAGHNNRNIPNWIRRFKRTEPDKLDNPRSREVANVKDALEWNREISRKISEASLQTYRFTHSKGNNPNAWFFTVAPEGRMLFVFADKDREKGKGEREAVIVHDFEVLLFETTNYIDPKGDTNPHEWKIVEDEGDRRRRLGELLASFKNANPHTRNSKAPWRGYFPDTKEVIDRIRSSLQA